MPTTLVDIHPHVIAGDTKRYPLAPLGGRQSDWSRDRPVSYEQMIRAMDEAGIQKAALVQASTCYGHDNTYVAEAVAAHADRFTGVFSVDVLASDAVEKMIFWMGKGLTGLRLFTTGSTMPGQADWLDDPRSFPAWEYAGKTCIPVCVQMTPKGIPQLVTLLERFPEVSVILDHLARPSLEDGPPYTAAQSLFELVKYRNVYLKVTPQAFAESQRGKATPETFFSRLVAEFGAPRIAWGSNYPTTAGKLTDLLALARKCLSSLSPQDHEWIFAKTAQVLYPALADK
jgi:L-fuconolactonase